MTLQDALVKIDQTALRVTRSLERPGARFGFDVSLTEMMAREMIELGDAMVERLR